MQLKGKRLLILGGTAASRDVVKQAQAMGVITVVTDDRQTGVAKDIADEKAMVSTTDIDGLVQLIKERNIDGVFCSPSEFQIRNAMKVCKQAGLPFYANEELWARCGNKDAFKAYCRQYGVDTPKQYDMTADITDEELDRIEYPIIIKPVDAASSRGVSVCRNKDEVRAAIPKALENSVSKRLLAEQYIENNGTLFNVRYLLRDGEPIPYFTTNEYLAQSDGQTRLVGTFIAGPARETAYFLEHKDQNVRNMIKGMGLCNGTVFFQSLPHNGKLYFCDMGHRLSGGLMFKLTEPVVGINDMKMMIRYALGGPMYTDEETAALDVYNIKRIGAQVLCPLSVGTIGKIEGLDAVCSMPCVVDCLQYYDVGDTIKPTMINTLAQLFFRLSIVTDSKEELLSAIQFVNDTLVITDTNGHRMNVMPFDIARFEE